MHGTVVLLDPHWFVQWSVWRRPRPQKHVWCSKQATWCSAEETGRTVQRCLCACIARIYLACPTTSVECERSFSVLLCQLTHNRLQSRLNHKLILVAHSARPVDLDGVIALTTSARMTLDCRLVGSNAMPLWQCVDGSVTVWMCDTVNVMNLMVVTYVIYFCECDAW